MITRRKLVMAIGAGALAPLASLAQHAGKVWRIGLLMPESAAAWATKTESFKKGLLELGYVEGKNIVIESRWADGIYDRMPAMAAELMRLKVDVIVTSASAGSLAAQRATTTIPIVILAIGDIVAAGLVTNLPHPGGNITGSTFFDTELSAKRIELLKDALPNAKHIGVLTNPDSIGNAWKASVQAVQAAAKSLRLELKIFEARRPHEFEPAFSAMAKARIDAIAILNQPLFDSEVNTKILAELALKHRLPSISGADFAIAGGLIGYGASFTEMYRRAAFFVDKIFKGAKPGDIPIEQPMRFDFVLNMKTAKALGLKIPGLILVQATKVIE